MKLYCIIRNHSKVLLAISTIALFFSKISALQSNAPGNPQSLTAKICDGRNDGRTLCDVELDVPAACVKSPSSSCPIVFFLHGSGGGNDGFKRRSGVHEEGLIGVYPQGEKGWNTGPKSTNVCHWSDFSCTSDPDEGDFIASIIEELRREGATGNIYAIGNSNGAALAHRLASNAGDEIPIKGIVVKVTQLLESPERSGPGVLNYNQPSLSGDRITPPVSVLSVMGTADGLIPYEGGSSGVFGGDDSFQLMPVLESMEFWATHNGCSGFNDPIVSNQASDIGTGNAIKYVYDGCPDGIAVEHYALEGGGHSAGGATIDGEYVDFDLAYDFIRRVESTSPSTPTVPVASPVAAPVSSPNHSCINDPNWAGKFNAAHTCDYVVQNPERRCFFQDTNGVSANEACPEACNSECVENPVAVPTVAPVATPVESPVEMPSTEESSCTNDESWAGKFNAAHTCDYIAQNPQRRCFFENSIGVTANEACPEACNEDCEKSGMFVRRRWLRRGQ